MDPFKRGKNHRLNNYLIKQMSGLPIHTLLMLICMLVSAASSYSNRLLAHRIHPHYIVDPCSANTTLPDYCNCGPDETYDGTSCVPCEIANCTTCARDNNTICASCDLFFYFNQ